MERSDVVSSDLSSLSVNQLRERATYYGIDTSSFLEKTEILEAVQKVFTERIKTAAELINSSGKIVVFTGAGISVESGIPDFRSKGGLWEKFDPSIYASYSHFLEKPSDFWEMMLECDKVISPAKPNPAHLALAELEKNGKLTCIVTQNIDGLHQQAGNTNIKELHGTSQSASCLDCKQKYDLNTYRELATKSIPLKCTKCGSEKVKADVILFEESLPEGIMEDSIKSLEEADLLIVIGSSLQVSPANLFPKIALKLNKKVLILNRDPTPIDPLAVVVYGNVGYVLPEILSVAKTLTPAKV